MFALEKNIMKPRSFKRRPRAEKEFDERVVEIARVSRVVKGGRRIRFRALVVIGDRKGKIGMGVARANEVANAVKKAVSHAKKKMVDVPVIDGTIPYEVIAKHDAARVILKPAAPGTSIIAGGAVRTVVELAGITDILGKILGTRSKVNNVRAVIKALSSFDAGYVAKIRESAERAEKKLLKKEEKAESSDALKKSEVGVPTESVGKEKKSEKNDETTQIDTGLEKDNSPKPKTKKEIPKEEKAKETTKKTEKEIKIKTADKAEKR